MYAEPKKSNCERCKVEIFKKIPSQKYCVICNATVGREKDKIRKDALKLKKL